VEDFGDRIEPYRAELRVHCYRMLGSLTDAEDALQETMLAAWRGRDGFEERSSLRTWLYRIATRQCLNVRRSAARRVPETPRPPFTPPPPSRLAEVTWLEPFPDRLLEAVPDHAPGPEARYGMREAIELAFVVGLQQLPPRQTAVLILKDVLGYSTDEVASLLDTTATAVKGALQRARATVGEPRAATPPSAAERALTQRFADAFAVRDIDALVSLLTDDAWLAMPPAPHEYHGIPAVLGFLDVSGTWRGEREMRLEPIRVNAQYAFAVSIDNAAAGLMVLTLRDARVAGMTRFLRELDPSMLAAGGPVED
jgi:RNA polymerase sigma-70 factor (ECF subfamily)